MPIQQHLNLRFSMFMILRSKRLMIPHSIQFMILRSKRLMIPHSIQFMTLCSIRFMVLHAIRFRFRCMPRQQGSGCVGTNRRHVHFSVCCLNRLMKAGQDGGQHVGHANGFPSHGWTSALENERFSFPDRRDTIIPEAGHHGGTPGFRRTFQPDTSIADVS
jgi:hypothetical protein